ncbi:MAG: PspC domain-containing protein [Caldilineaceae bacterium]|nr:PspC domain-containing protein [Caldilineaceae bacterium]
MEHTTEDILIEATEEKRVQPDGLNVMNVETTEQAGASSRTIYRHPTDKMVAGVCGGLAEFLGWDATFIRLFWVVMTLATGGGGFLAYLALWLLLPVGTMESGQLRAATIALNERNMIRAAYALIGLGALWLLANVGVLGNLWGLAWSLLSVFFWPALLIGAGYLLLRGSNRDMKGDFTRMRGRVKMSMNGKVPSGDEVKAGMKDVKERIPLKRSRQDRMILGVCGGLGRKLGIDANLVRLIWAAFSIGSIGVGVLIYVAVGLLLPEETEADLMRSRMESENVQVVDGTVNNAA